MDYGITFFYRDVRLCSNESVVHFSTHNYLFNGLFPLTQGVAVSSAEESKLTLEEQNTCVKEEKCENNVQLVIYQATDSSLAENILSPPMIADCRLVYHIYAHIIDRKSESSLLCKY